MTEANRPTRRGKPTVTAEKQAAADARKAKLEAALKANIARRKAQAAGRRCDESANDGGL